MADMTVDVDYLRGLEETVDHLQEQLAFYESYKKFYVPHLGSKLQLAEPWTFTLHPEHRNSKLWDAVTEDKIYDHMRGCSDPLPKVTFPIGAILSVARIYIRQGGKEYDSVTFRSIKGSCGDQKHLEKKRFWAKLKDVHEMTVEILDEE